MIERRNDCVSCERCHGCGRCNGYEVRICDNCGTDDDVRYTINDEDFCKDCAIELVTSWFTQFCLDNKLELDYEPDMDEMMEILEVDYQEHLDD